MGVEIERKFLLRSDAWRDGAGEGVPMKQGYFAGVPGESPTVRIRIAGPRAFLTIKGTPDGLARSEFEYEVPVADAEAMLREFMQLRVTEANINEFGRFDKLKATVNRDNAKAFLEALERTTIKPFQINMKVDQVLRKFILEGGFDIA